MGIRPSKGGKHAKVKARAEPLVVTDEAAEFAKSMDQLDGGWVTSSGKPGINPFDVEVVADGPNRGRGFVECEPDRADFEMNDRHYRFLTEKEETEVHERILAFQHDAATPQPQKKTMKIGNILYIECAQDHPDAEIGAADGAYRRMTPEELEVHKEARGDDGARIVVEHKFKNRRERRAAMAAARKKRKK